MVWKPIAAAAVLACLATPAAAWDTLRDEPHTMLFIKVPLDGRSPGEQMPSWGLSLRGNKEYQVFSLDSRSMRSFTQMGFVESKILVVGAIAAAAAVAVAASGSSSAAQQQQQLAERQAQQQAAQQQQPPTPPACPQKPAC